MKIKNLISVKIEIFFSHTYYMYIFRLFLSYIVLNRSFLYIFVTNIHIYQHGLTPRRVAEAPGPRALRAGRQEAEAPGPALCRPVAIHTRLGVGRAGSQQAPPSTNLGVTGHPGPAAEARLVMSKKLAHILPGLTPRRAAEAPGPRALRAGRQETEAPGPALCRPLAIHTRLGVGRAGSQPASTALDKPRSDGSPRAGG